MNRTEAKLANAVLNEPLWALTSSAFDAIRDTLRGVEEGGPLGLQRCELESGPYLVEGVGGRARQTPYAGDVRRATEGPAKAVLVVPIHGLIHPRSGMWSLYGGANLQELLRVLRRAVHDPSIGSILADVDSPGGLVAGVPEAAAAIRGLRGRKPMVAVANFQCASAAYYLASQFDELIASPSSSVGSIGVIAQYFSAAKALEKEGLTVQTFKFPHLKAEADGVNPLTDEAVAFRMASIKAAYADFEEAVSLGRRRPRSVVAERFGNGRSFDASAALAAGMIDRIQTFDSLLAEHTSGDCERAATRRAAIRDAAMLAARWGLTPPSVS